MQQPCLMFLTLYAALDPKETMTAHNDGEENVRKLTKSDEVYILTNLSSFSPPDRANVLERNKARPKSWAIR